MNIHELRQTLQRRLVGRQLQAAQQGIMADPMIKIEQENLIAAIGAIDVAVHNKQFSGPKTMSPFEERVRITAQLAGVIIDVLEY